MFACNGCKLLSKEGRQKDFFNNRHCAAFCVKFDPLFFLVRAKGLNFNIDDETAFDTLRLAWVNWHMDVPRLHVRRSHAFGKKRLIAEFLQCDEGSHWQKIRSFPCPKATISWGSLLSCSSRAPVTRDSLSLPAEWRGKRHHQLEVFLAVRRADGHQAGRARVFCQPPWSTLPPHVWCCEGEDQGQRWEEEQQEEEGLISLVVDVVVAANRQVVN